MNVLITGASGFLGSKIYSKFPYADTLGRDLSNNIVIDLALEIPIFNKKYDLVIHCAALAHKDPTDKIQENKFYEVNYAGTLNLLKGLTRLGPPKKFVLVSTVAVYGLLIGENINEDHQLDPDTAYAKSKSLSEEITISWGKSNNVKVTILRLPLVIGTNPPGNLGSMIRGIKNGYYFNISGGTAKKSMVLASDVVKFMLKASEVGGIYNLTDGYHPNFYELSRNIGVQLGKNFIPNISIFFAKILAFIGDKLVQKFPINSDKLNKITYTLTFDDSKARKAFGWNPTPVLKGFKIDK